MHVNSSPLAVRPLLDGGMDVNADARWLFRGVLALRAAIREPCDKWRD
jgi:hypothetical protein